MKTIPTILLLSCFIFFGSGCTSPKIEDDFSQRSAFDKKKECSKYIAEVENGIAKRNLEFAHTGIQESLFKVCYSPKIDTCISVIRERSVASNDKTEGEGISYNNLLTDEGLGEALNFTNEFTSKEDKAGRRSEYLKEKERLEEEYKCI